MRRSLVLLAFVAWLPSVASARIPHRVPPQPASPLAGIWRLDQNNVRIRIADCGGAICGRLLSADRLRADPRLKDKMNADPALRGRPVAGLQVLSGFTGGPDKWTGGRIYDPNDGKTYNSDLTLVGQNTLQVRGCVIKPLCKTRTLTRAG